MCCAAAVLSAVLACWLLPLMWWWMVVASTRVCLQQGNQQYSVLANYRYSVPGTARPTQSTHKYSVQVRLYEYTQHIPGTGNTYLIPQIATSDFSPLSPHRSVQYKYLYRWTTGTGTRHTKLVIIGVDCLLTPELSKSVQY